MKVSTNLIKAGRKARSAPKTVNLPVVRASTVVFESIAEPEAIQKRFDADEVVPTYGIPHTPLRAAFEELMVEIEGLSGGHVRVRPRGQRRGAARVRRRRATMY